MCVEHIRKDVLMRDGKSEGGVIARRPDYLDLLLLLSRVVDGPDDLELEDRDCLRTTEDNIRMTRSMTKKLRYNIHTTSF